MPKPKSFVIVRGGFQGGFSFMGPVPTAQRAREWNDGHVMEILEPYDYEGKPGKYALVTGTPLMGFAVHGTFLNRLAAMWWRDNQQDFDDHWVIELEEYFQRKG